MQEMVMLAGLDPFVNNEGLEIDDDDNEADDGSDNEARDSGPSHGSHDSYLNSPSVMSESYSYT